MVDSISYNVDESDGDYKDFHLEDKGIFIYHSCRRNNILLFGEK